MEPELKDIVGIEFWTSSHHYQSDLYLNSNLHFLKVLASEGAGNLSVLRNTNWQSYIILSLNVVVDGQPGFAGMVGWEVIPNIWVLRHNQERLYWMY